MARGFQLLPFFCRRVVFVGLGVARVCVAWVVPSIELSSETPARNAETTPPPRVVCAMARDTLQGPPWRGGGWKVLAASLKLPQTDTLDILESLSPGLVPFFFRHARARRRISFGTSAVITGFLPPRRLGHRRWTPLAVMSLGVMSGNPVARALVAAPGLSVL